MKRTVTKRGNYMKHTYLHDVLPFLRELEKEKQKQFETYFRTAPLWLMDMFQSEVMEAGTIFIRENEPADTIFFVAKGRVKATDYRVSGIAYDFMKPMNLIALGGMEVILGQMTYQTTLADRNYLHCSQASKSTVRKMDLFRYGGVSSGSKAYLCISSGRGKKK